MAHAGRQLPDFSELRKPVARLIELCVVIAGERGEGDEDNRDPRDHPGRTQQAANQLSPSLLIGSSNCAQR